MGLTVVVGLIASNEEDDPDSVAYLQSQLAAINATLRAAGLPEHHEPSSLAPEHEWGADMYGYSGLHYLRRIAAHLAFGRPVPAPGDDDSAYDRILAQYHADTEGAGRGWLSRLRMMPRPRREFDHLLNHSDAEGYYVPIDFKDVLFPEPELNVAGAMIGSSQRLLHECNRLAKALDIPDGVDPDGDDLWEAAESQGQGTGWRRYGVEAFTCVRLREAARRSISAKALIVFA